MQYEHRFSVAIRLCYAIRIMKLCCSYCVCIINIMHVRHTLCHCYLLLSRLSADLSVEKI